MAKQTLAVGSNANEMAGMSAKTLATQCFAMGSLQRNLSYFGDLFFDVRMP